LTLLPIFDSAYRQVIVARHHIADLDELAATEVEQDCRRLMLRSTPRIAASLALRAAGVALPPTVQAIADN
jgi:hypothetical protein